MNKLSGLMNAREPRATAKFCKAIVLAILVLASPIAVARGQSTPKQLQQSKASQKAAESYRCLMHPEVKSTKRGKCSKCGMALRLAPRDTSAALSVGPDKSLNANGGIAEPLTAAPSRTGTVDADTVSTMKMNIPDVAVLDQDGNRLHFYSDLTRDKTIAINFIFTTCTTICPPLAATFARVQKQMGDRVGRDVHFISISVDPVTDTPQRLKAWGAKFRAGAGWTFVTGAKVEIDKLLNALGASVGRREDHSPTVIIGNDLTGEWTRTYGLAKPSQMVELILKVMAGKPSESVAKEPHQ